MKKRLIAMMLVLCTVVALLGGMSISASAENDISADTLAGYVISYTMVKDDTVAKICKRLGIDFHKNQSEITKINNITDYSSLPVGTVLWLPATEIGSAENYYTLKTHKISANDTLTGLCAKYGISTGDVLLNRINSNLSNLVVGETITFPVYTGSGNGLGVSASAASDSAAASSTGTGTSSATTISSTTTTGTASGDTVAYYLIPYTMQNGDTVANVCAALGISFNANQALITRVNNITNYSRVPVGRTILLPSASPSSGTCYKVISHTLASGEYVYALCSSYGISYSSSQALLKALNNTNYLESVKVGNQFLIPIAGTYSDSSSDSSSGSSSGSGTTTGAAHNLTKVTATNGSFALKVDGVESTIANAGETVTVVCSGSTGYVETEISVYKTGAASTVVAVSNNTFVMPDYDVTVKVTFSKASAYTLTYNTVEPASSATFVVKENGSVVALKNSAYSAYAGSTMTVEVTPKSGYVFDELRVQKEDGKFLAVSGTSFTMPASNVTITVYMKKGSDFEYKLNGSVDGGNGTITFLSGNAVVSKAKAGSVVTVSPSPAAGYTLESIKATYTDVDGIERELTVSKNAFTMPAYKVTVVAKFVTTTTHTITLKTDSKTKTGIYTTVLVNGADVKTNKVAEGKDVYIFSSDSRYEIDEVNVYKAGDLKTIIDTVGQSFTYSYDYDIVLVPTLVAVSSTYSVNVAGSNKVTAKVTYNGSTQKIASGGSYADIVPGSTVLLETTVKNGFELAKISATYEYAGASRTFTTVTSGNCSFKMPEGDVTITYETIARKYNLSAAAPEAGPNGTDDSNVSFYVNNKKEAQVKAAAGDTVTVAVACADGDVVKSISVTYVDPYDSNKVKTVTVSGNTFTMPVGDVTATVKFEAEVFKIYCSSSDETQGTVQALDANEASVTSCAYNGTVEINATPASGYALEKIVVTDCFDQVLQEETSSPFDYTMPNYDVRVKAYFTSKDKEITIVAPDSSEGTLGVAVNGQGKVDGDTIDVGSTVVVSTMAEDGYVLKELKVYSTDAPNVSVTVTDGKFVMPAYPVTVEATFRKLAEATIVFDEDMEIPAGCRLKVLADGVVVTPNSDGSYTIREGKQVVIESDTTGGHTVSKVVVTVIDNGDAVSMINSNTFTMLNYNLKVSVTFD